MAAPFSKDEEARLSALHKYGILDTAPESAYDDIARLAADICGTPIAAVSLVDADRQWFKAAHGLDVRETPRDTSFCAHAILQPDVMVVPDAALDPRFAANPLVTGEPHIRFYAGAPLITSDGHALGSLCVLDRVPRRLTDGQVEALRSLARQTSDRLELARAAAAWRRGDVMYRRLVESGVIGINLWDLDGRLTWVNDRFLAMSGYTRADMNEGRLRWDEMTPPEWQAATAEATRQIHAGSTFRAYEKEFFRKDGTRVPVLLGGALLEGGSEGVSFILDLSDQKRAAYERSRSEESLRILAGAVTNAVDGMTISDAHQADLPLVYVNPAFTAVTGFTEEEALGHNCRFLQGEGTDPEARRQVREAVEAGRACRVTLLNYRKDGTPFWNELNIAPMHDEAGVLTHFVGIQHDVTDLKNAEMQNRQDNLILEVRKAQLEAANAELAMQATTDPVTGLLNHRAFQARMRQEEDAQRHEGATPAVAVLDVDDFRFFNDVYGHGAGDRALRLIAERLREVCGSRDALARFGGDDFTLLLADVGDATAAQVEARLTTALAGVSYQDGGQVTPIPLTVTVGAALLPDGPGQHEALHLANERLRWAKTGGSTDTEAGTVRTAMRDRVQGFSMLDALVAAVDNKDRYTRRHSEDVLEHSLAIARGLGMGERERHTVAVAALLHDVGKIGVPDYVLRKPGRLTEAEFEAVRQHPMMGAIIVQAVPGLEGTLDAVRHHHERWDGGGYPFGLRGEETPLVARLMAVADAYSAMTTDRPYRAGMAPDRARAILRAGAGTQWDPACVQAFLQDGP